MVTTTLAPVLDLTAAADLKQALLEAGSGATIDASAVQRITSPCLQILAAAVQGGARMAPASAALVETAAVLGLLGVLGISS